LQFKQTFPALQNERYTVPSLVAYVELRYSEGRGHWIRRHRLVIQVTQLGVTFTVGVTDVLTQNEVIQGQRLDGLEYFDLHSRHSVVHQQVSASRRSYSQFYLQVILFRWMTLNEFTLHEHKFDIGCSFLQCTTVFTETSDRGSFNFYRWASSCCSDEWYQRQSQGSFPHLNVNFRLHFSDSQWLTLRTVTKVKHQLRQETSYNIVRIYVKRYPFPY